MSPFPGRASGGGEGGGPRPIGPGAEAKGPRPTWRMTVKRNLWILGALTVALAASAAVGQEAELILQLEAEQKKLSKQRDDLRKQLRAIEVRLAGDVDVAALYKIYDKASAAYEEDRKTARAIVAARKAEKAASDEYQAAEKAAAENDPALKALKAEAEAAEKAVGESRKQRQVADSALFKIRWRILRSDALKALRAEGTAKDKAIRELRANDPDLVAARKALDETNKAYDKARRELPEYKAMQAALKALNNAVKNHAGVKAIEAEKAAARKAIDRRVEALLPADPEGAAALAAVKAAEKARADGRSQSIVLQKKIHAATSAAVAKDPPAKDALKARDAARKARRKVERESTVETRGARDTAWSAYTTRLRAKFAADARGTDLSTQLKTADDRSRKIRRQIRDMKTKQAKPPATE